MRQHRLDHPTDTPTYLLSLRVLVVSLAKKKKKTIFIVRLYAYEERRGMTDVAIDEEVGFGGG